MAENFLRNHSKFDCKEFSLHFPPLQLTLHTMLKPSLPPNDLVEKESENPPFITFPDVFNTSNLITSNFFCFFHDKLF
ncbi:hypothetical protein Ga0061079_104136 [Apibacter mensalis]|uniref:Uncharacterized protein n=1 Tax=Apibacter mensalis TaxID=1586267 RepID=A0A0X3APD9_9FLAO|nr:hypothetical protein [Apibacter mensalis]CVK16017.1 hypothetical protein Ga0061079_104136 [Apibacter mensalis]